MEREIHLIRRSEEQRKRDWIIGNIENDTKAICKCGKKIKMRVVDEEAICHWCGNKLKNNSKAHFRYKMREIINK